MFLDIITHSLSWNGTQKDLSMETLIKLSQLKLKIFGIILHHC